MGYARQVVSLGIALSLAAPVLAQTPVPFPKPNQPVSPLPPAKTPDAPPPAPAAAALTASPQGEPTEALLGAPIYPGAQFLTSYDAGGAGQRFYLYGTNLPFTEIVAYYKKVLRKGGDEIFQAPPVHMFDTGRFREDTMAFPPSVTVKDYSGGAAAGYLNPKRGAEPARFRTIIQIVPPPPGPPSR